MTDLPMSVGKIDGIANAEPLLEGDYPQVVPEPKPFREARARRKPVSKSPVKDAATESSAKTAAGLLSKLNLLIALSVSSLKMPETAEAIMKANEEFEELAYEALLNDPILCKKIMSTGATSGKAGLTIAYATMAIPIVSTAKLEIQEKRRAKNNDESAG